MQWKTFKMLLLHPLSDVHQDLHRKLKLTPSQAASPTAKPLIYITFCSERIQRSKPGNFCPWNLGFFKTKFGCGIRNPGEVHWQSSESSNWNWGIYSVESRIHYYHCVRFPKGDYMAKITTISLKPQHSASRQIILRALQKTEMSNFNGS